MMKRILPIILVLCLLLCACGGQPEPTPTPTAQPSEAPSAEPTPTAQPTPTPEPTPTPVAYRNPLNGQAMDAPYEGRVFAVTINNVPQAFPHHGVGQADVLFEMFINDYCTRGLALYTDVSEMESIGSIRSTRYNFTDLALAYNLIVVHANASKAVLTDMYNEGVDNLNADSSIGYRDSYRYNTQGYAWEHTLFAKGESLVQAAKDKGFELQVADKDYGMNFVDDGTPANGESAEEIEIVFTLYGHTKGTTMKYDAESGKYIYWQYGKEMIDENSGEPEGFENVIVIRTDVKNDGVYHVANMYGSGDGYYACNGQIVPIKWTHENETDPFTFTLTDGTPLYQGVGSTYVAVVPSDSPVNY